MISMIYTSEAIFPHSQGVAKGLLVYSIECMLNVTLYHVIKR